MTGTELKTAPQPRRASRKSFLTALVSKRDSGDRTRQSEADALELEYREVLAAIHRPSR
jgi:hypothetical protein